ncbi:hypothetical protein HOC80_00205 [archaeon]|jgi:hypothetical protein|nr:hypothetical protein [archaeon]MBT4416506.1 hypothetical protein [archaeon]
MTQEIVNEGNPGCAHGYVSFSMQRSVFEEQQEEQMYRCDLCGRTETRSIEGAITMTFPRFAMVSIDGQNYIHRANGRGKIETEVIENHLGYSSKRMVPTNLERWTNKAAVFREASQ